MIYFFGNYSLNTASLSLLDISLSDSGQPVDVEPQVFELLLMLLENRDRVVKKDELIATIWKGRIVSDSAISTRVKSARQAIGDSGKQQQWIKTVHRYGFRFIGDVSEVGDGDLSSTVLKHSQAPEHQSSTLDQRPGILVLPFEVVQGGDDSIFAQGLAHDIIASLSRLRWLKVIARASAFQLSDASISQSDRHALVDAKYCVSGRLSRRKDAIEINIRIDNMVSDSVLWADSIVFSSAEVNQIRHEIVNRVINLLELHISEHEAQRAMLKSTDSLNAWEAYHRAMMHFSRFTPQDNQLALDLFSRAVTIDPLFARAQAGLSSAAFQNAFNRYPGVDNAKAIDQAIHHAEKSIALDRMDPLANFVMGRTHWLTGEPSASLPWLERAVAVNPNYAQGYYAHGLASLLSSDDLRGYVDSEQAATLSPLDPFLYGFYGIRAFSYLADGDQENAHHWAEEAAYQPEALVVMDLLAAATSHIAKQQDKADMWLQRARSRNPQIDSQQFFTALPFATGEIRSQLSAAFQRLGI